MTGERLQEVSKLLIDYLNSHGPKDPKSTILWLQDMKHVLMSVEHLKHLEEAARLAHYVQDVDGKNRRPLCGACFEKLKR